MKAAIINKICSPTCIEWKVTDKSYKAGRCHIENTRLNITIATIGCNINLSVLSIARFFRRGVISQAGVPNIINGGATKVNRTC